MNRQFLLISHLKVHNANALSSPYTIGFPAMTAWLGATHFLQRQLQQNGFGNVNLPSVAISCHHIDLQTHKGHGDFVHSIIGTSNPLDNNGNRPAFIEEARCHLEVSILIEYQGLNPDDSVGFIEFINNQLQKMKFAGGDVSSFKKIELISVDEDEEKSIKKALNKLMVGYVLVNRSDLVKKSMIDGKDALDALLDHLKVMHRSSPNPNDDDKFNWASSKKESGWLVPIATGFQGISEIGIAKNQRDIKTPHRFAESVVTLGEFIMPCRIENLDDILWQYHIDQDLYLCQTLTNLKK
ncbi:MAG: CRISPR-associated protein Csy2 [Lentimonas sp.]|jgi:CRISPR-associated protein Csy2